MNTEAEKTEQIPLHGNLIEWKYEHLTDADIQIVLDSAPDEESRDALYEKFPAGHHFKHFIGKMVQSRLVWDSVEKAFKQLEEVRTEGIPTHAAGHAAASLFKKMLDMFRLHHIHSPIAFRKHLDQAIERVKEAFAPVLAVLVLNYEAMDDGKLYFYTTFSKREKHALLRAQWPGFLKAWTTFSAHDWHNEYQALFNYCLQKTNLPSKATMAPGTTTVSDPPRYEEGGHITELDVEGTELLGGEPVTPSKEEASKTTVAPVAPSIQPDLNQETKTNQEAKKE